MSADLNKLHPMVQTKATAMLAACAAAGMDVRVTSTYRSVEEQNALYAQGRTTPGTKVTKAKGGYSWHNFGLAFDVVPFRDGKPIWDTTQPEWPRLIKIGKAQGLESGADWPTFPDMPHFQYTAGVTLAECRAWYLGGLGEVWKHVK